MIVLSTFVTIVGLECSEGRRGKTKALQHGGSNHANKLWVLPRDSAREQTDRRVKIGGKTDKGEKGKWRWRKLKGGVDLRGEERMRQVLNKTEEKHTNLSYSH